MNNYADISKWLCESYRPLIAVESSKSAEQTCKETGLSAIQLLRPFTAEEDLKYTFHAEGHDVVVNNLHFNLEYSSLASQLKAEQIEEELIDALIPYEPKTEDNKIRIKEIKNDKVTSAISQPWILGYMSSLVESLRYGDSNLLGHPLAVILVVSSSDSDPIRRFDELSQKVFQKSEFVQSMYTKSIPFYYFLVHSADSMINADDIYRNMKASFNASQCKVIRLNSLPHDCCRVKCPPAYNQDPSITVCTRMSDDDIAAIQAIMHSLLSRGVMQNLDKLLSSYIQDVITNRRGLANALFGWLRNSSSGNVLSGRDNSSDSDAVLYHKDSIEFKIRFVADMAFMLKDYDTAIDYYKMVLEDYKTNNSFFQLAEVSQQISLSLFLVGSRPNSGGLQIREISYFFQQAIKYYKSAVSTVSTYHVYLASSLHVLLLNCQEITRKSKLFSFNDMISLLAANTMASDVSSAVMLAWIGWMQEVAGKRRSVFSYVLGGLKFKKLELIGYALWCIIEALKLCKSVKWGHIHGYLLSEMQTLIQTDRNIDLQMLKIAQELSFDTNQWNKRFDCECVKHGFFTSLATLPQETFPIILCNCSLPYIDSSSISVKYQENKCDDESSRWAYITNNGGSDDIIAGIMSPDGRRIANITHITQFSNKNLYDSSGSDHCIHVNQRICVHCTVQNPLDESISCNAHVQVLVRGEKPSKSDVAVMDSSVLIQPLQTVTLDLLVTPLQATIMSIEGIEFTVASPMNLQHVLHVSQRIPFKVIHVNTRRDRYRRQYDTVYSLPLHVYEMNGGAQCDISCLKDFYFFSELANIRLHIENHGDHSISSIILHTSCNNWYFKQSLSPVASQGRSLLAANEVLAAGAVMDVSSYLHLPDSVSSPDMEVTTDGSDMFVLRYVLTIEDVMGHEYLLRGCYEIRMKPLLSCRGSFIDSENSIYQSVVENISEDQEIDEIVLFSSCPYCHISPSFPAVLSSVSMGSVHSVVVRLLAVNDDCGRGTSVHVLKDMRYSSYLEYIESFDTFENRMNHLNVMPHRVDEDHRFIDLLWVVKEDGDNCLNWRIGFCMLLIKLYICY